MQNNPSATLLLTGQVAKILDLSPEMVRVLERRGKLAALKTVGGVRLYDLGDVERLREQRAEQRAALAVGVHELHVAEVV